MMGGIEEPLPGVVLVAAVLDRVGAAMRAGD
jgi:hypothetical protein